MTFTANATSNAGVTAVKFQSTAPGTAPFTDCAGDRAAGPYSCSWATSGITYGSYTITAVMTRGDGSTVTSAPVAVTVDNRTLAGGRRPGHGRGRQRPAGPGDTITLTYAGLANLSTIKPGWPTARPRPSASR